MQQNVLEGAQQFGSLTLQSGPKCPNGRLSAGGGQGWKLKGGARSPPTLKGKPPQRPLQPWTSRASLSWMLLPLPGVCVCEAFVWPGVLCTGPCAGRSRDCCLLKCKFCGKITLSSRYLQLRGKDWARPGPGTLPGDRHASDPGGVQMRVLGAGPGSLTCPGPGPPPAAPVQNRLALPPPPPGSPRCLPHLTSPPRRFLLEPGRAERPGPTPPPQISLQAWEGALSGPWTTTLSPPLPVSCPCLEPSFLFLFLILSTLGAGHNGHCPAPSPTWIWLGGQVIALATVSGWGGGASCVYRHQHGPQRQAGRGTGCRPRGPGTPESHTCATEHLWAVGCGADSGAAHPGQGRTPELLGSRCAPGPDFQTQPRAAPV